MKKNILTLTLLSLCSIALAQTETINLSGHGQGLILENSANDAGTYVTFIDHDNKRANIASFDDDYRDTRYKNALQVFARHGKDIRFATSTDGNAGTNRLTILNSGKIGIGTATPESNLTVVGSGTIGSRFDPDKAYFQLSNGTVTMLMDGNEITTNEQLVFGTAYDHDFSFHNIDPTSNQELFRIKSNGSVGIGSNNPFQKLTVIDGQVFLGNSTVNKVESGRIRFGEYTNSFQGAFIHYNGSANVLNIGVNNINDATSANDVNSISIRRDNGRVGIGTSETGSHQLAVEGSIGAREIKVEVGTWSDFVFDREYKLPTLEEVEEHINQNGHLPEIPSEEEVTENGINLGEMNAKLLQKIEELTLYLIEQNKEIKELKKEISALKHD